MENNLLNYFLIVYFYKIEHILNQPNNGIENIQFQSEEANTDEYLKKYFQDFLSKHNDISDIHINKLAIKIDNNESFIEIEKLKSFKIINVFLPKELTLAQKEQIKNTKKSVYTNPDLYLEIQNGKNSYFESIELKSTKNDIIPGSSIQQITLFESVIFIKHTKNTVSVTTGFYLNSITEKLHFPEVSQKSDM